MSFFDVFWAFGVCFGFLYFGVDWKGRVPALMERGLFGFGFCVPSDISLEKRARPGSDGLWPFLNGSNSCIVEFRFISETFEKKCSGFCGALEKGHVLAVTERGLFWLKSMFCCPN